MVPFIALGFLLGSLALNALLGDNGKSGSTKGGFATAVEVSGGKGYEIKEAGFRAAFPSAPKREVSTEQLGSFSFTLNTYGVEEGQGEGVGVVVMDLPTDMPFDLHAGLQGSATPNGSLVSESPIAVDGVEGVQGVVKVDQQQHRGMPPYIGEVIVRHGTRIYTLMVYGQDNPPKGLMAFVNSFAFDK